MDVRVTSMDKAKGQNGVVINTVGEGYLADIALIYSMISFLAVIILSKGEARVELLRVERSEQAKARGGTPKRDLVTSPNSFPFVH